MRSQLLSKYSASMRIILANSAFCSASDSLRSAAASFSILPFSNQSSLRISQRVCALHWQDAGRTATKIIPEALVPQTREQIAEYHRLRDLTRDLVDVN